VRSALKWLQESGFRSAEIDDPTDWSDGEDVRSVIADKIRNADTVVLVWSDRAASSPWVQYEIGMAQALGIPIRVLVAGGSRAELPAGLTDAEVIEFKPAKPESDEAVPAPRAEASLSTALEGLSQQYQRIEQQIQEVRTLLGGNAGTLAGRTTRVAGKAKKQVLSAAARKRIAEATRRRWAEYRKRKAAVDSGN